MFACPAIASASLCDSVWRKRGSPYLWSSSMGVWRRKGGNIRRDHSTRDRCDWRSWHRVIRTKYQAVTFKREAYYKSTGRDGGSHEPARIDGRKEAERSD